MAKFDADAHKGLHDPIEFRLGGKDYTVREVTDGIMAEITAMQRAFLTAEAEESPRNLGEMQNRLLALLTEAPAEEFASAAVPTKTAVIGWVMARIYDPLGAGTPKPARS